MNSSIILIYIQSSKKMTQLNRNLLSLLGQTLPPQILSSFTRAFKAQQQNQHKKMNTPATNSTNTSWRKQGNAIEIARRKRKINPAPAPQQNQQMPPPSTDQPAPPQQSKNGSTMVSAKSLIKSKAVFFGQHCELPYLHSSDAISHLYQRRMADQTLQQTPLFNPPASTDPVLLANLRSLHIYHTPVDSLRQLGTGWCHLKELSILYAQLIDLSGLSSFSALEYLFVGFNQISSLADLMFHPSLRCIDLQRNRIQNMEQVEYLATIDKLQYVNLNNNGVMRVKESKRIVQQKLGKILDIEENTRLIDYQLEEMTKYHQVMSFQNIQMSNAVLKNCNDLLGADQISLERLFESYQSTDINDEKIQAMDFVRYEKKAAFEESIQEENICSAFYQDEQIIFTPLFHFLNGKKHYTSILKRYLQNKLYLPSKKTQNHSQSPSPAHSITSTIQSHARFNKLTSSTRLQKDQDIYSLDKKQIATTDLNSIDKAKRTRLSLGKTKRLLQKYQKPALTGGQQPKMISNLGTTANPSSGKTFTLKRSSMLMKKASVNDLQLQIDKKFSKTSAIRCQQ